MKRLCFLLVLCFLAGIVHAQTLRPRIALVNPSGGQRGTTVTFSLTGPNLGLGTQLAFEGPGLTVEALTAEAPPTETKGPDGKPVVVKNPEGKVVARVKIAPDAPLGLHPFRVQTPLGPSTVGAIVVGEWPEVAEKEPNNTPEQAQALTGPVTLVGRSDNGDDVDVYRVTIPQGQTMVFSAAAGSIGSAMTPVLTLKDATGHERAFAAALRQPDALLSFTALQTGDYFLFVHDLRYQGGAPFYYRLTVGAIPAVTSVFPLGGAAGATTYLTLTGINLPLSTVRTVTLPKEIPFAPMPLPDASNMRLEVGMLPEVMEAEPNDTPDTAQRVTPPVTINGRIYNPKMTGPDVDCFRFAATKGQVFALEVVAARLGSPLDAVLSVLDASGKELATNDDTFGRDPALKFTVPADGEYIAQVKNLNGQSDESFTYRLHIAPPVPDFRLSFHPDCLTIGPGDRTPFTITAARQNGFDGDIPLTITGLPAGVQLVGTPTIAKGQTSVTLMAVADAGVAISATHLDVTGTATIGGKAVVRRAESQEENYIRDGDQLKLTTRPVPLPFVAVTGPPDLLLTVGADKLTLALGKTVELKVSVTRKAGFTAKIPIIIQGLPANVGVTGVEIPENKTEATITLKAEGNAPVGDATLTLLGRSLVDDLHFTDHAAVPVTLTVVK